MSDRLKPDFVVSLPTPAHIPFEEHPDLKVELDPTGHFKENNVSADRLILAIGVIPSWACRAAHSGTVGASMKDSCNRWYPYGLYESTGGEVKEDGTYHFPEDPPLYPLFKMTFNKPDSQEIMYIYQHAIVAFIKTAPSRPKQVFVTRID